MREKVLPDAVELDVIDSPSSPPASESSSGCGAVRSRPSTGGGVVGAGVFGKGEGGMGCAEGRDRRFERRLR